MLCVSIEIFKHDIYYSILFWTVKIFHGKTIYIKIDVLLHNSYIKNEISVFGSKKKKKNCS